jgi:hypothetical protein
VLVAIFIPGLLNSMWYGPLFACVQGVVAPRNRALAAAVILFVLNLIGLGFGPTLVGWASDVFAAQSFTSQGAGAFSAVCVKGGPAEFVAACKAASAAGLEKAIIIASVIGVLAALFMWLARNHLATDMTRARETA